jgi:hypothetical protein
MSVVLWNTIGASYRETLIAEWPYGILGVSILRSTVGSPLAKASKSVLMQGFGKR